MPTTPEPEWPHIAKTGPTEPVPATGGAFRPPSPSEPQPSVFGPTSVEAKPPPAPAAQAWRQPPSSQPAPRPQRPLPSIGSIWLNIVVFGWFLGLGLIYGCYQAIQGIIQSRQRGLSPAKYIAPLAFIAAVFLLLVIIGAMLPNSTPSTGTGYGQ